MKTSARRRHRGRPAKRIARKHDESFASVYVDKAATSDAVRAAVAQVPTPVGVAKVRIDGRSVSDTFGCRIAIDLTGTFNERTEGRSIARWYAQQLSALLGVPVFALYDLLRDDPDKF